MSNSWKITIPVMRAEERSDGLYLIGEATGPERDTHGTAMAPEAIVDFARQIRERVDAGDPLPYIDNHMKVGVLRELGAVMDGSVTPDFHLQIAVRLDDGNPAALFLHNNLQRGKQYGMSIAGDGTEFQKTKDETGANLVRFTKVVLREISNTTKPSWVPSLGTVLARSLEGDDSTMPDELVTEAAPVTETVAPEESAPEAVVENAAEEQTPETETPAAAEVEVERARISKADAAAMLATYKAMGEQLKALGIEVEAAPENTTVENSDTGEEAEELVEFGGVTINRSLSDAITSAVTIEVARATETLAKTVAEQTDYIKALENLPAGKLPHPIVREKFESADQPDLSKMTPADRLRWGLEGIYGDR